MALRGFALSKMRREKTGILDLALSPDLLCNIQIHMIWIKLFKSIARNTNIHLLIQTSTTFILRATPICFGNFRKRFLSFFVHTFFLVLTLVDSIKDLLSRMWASNVSVLRSQEGCWSQFRFSCLRQEKNAQAGLLKQFPAISRKSI